MEDTIFLTVFTDPMMGLSYESEPILARLQTEYGEVLKIRYAMSVLVRDVSDFMTPEEQALEPEAGIRLYCRRLAQIYKSEEIIGGLPTTHDEEILRIVRRTGIDEASFRRRFENGDAEAALARDQAGARFWLKKKERRRIMDPCYAPFFDTAAPGI